MRLSIRKACPKDAFKPVIAVKFINKEHAYKIGRVKPKQIEAEIGLHSHVGKHQNIIQFLATGSDPHWTWIAMELANGDLFDKIEADIGIGEDIAHFYFLQLVSAVGYMHSKSVAHRDIKPENILLANGDLKLADFGLAVLFEYHGKRKPCQTVCGSPPYMAPEVVPKGGFSGRKTDPYEGAIADIWSCGIVLFVLLVGNTPWDEPTNNSFEFNHYIEQGATDELWQRIPHQAVSLLRGILKVDPRQRMTLEDVRRHPWYTRPNPYMAKDGRVANPVGLATQMLENLRIDFESDPMASSQRPAVRHDPNAMDVDEDIGRLALTQPETPLAEITFDWERPAPLAAPGRISASQPISGVHGPAAFTITDRLAQDPALSQFSIAPTVPLSVTQNAKRFQDVLPEHSMTRFMSFMDFPLLLPLLCEALQRLGIPARAEQTSPTKAAIQIKTRDQRKCRLVGTIVVEPVEDEVWEVRFLKAVGDPLEWRRLFKKVTVLCKDAIWRPDQ